MRRRGIVAGTAALALAALLAASPASAATLPAGQRISVAANSSQFEDPQTTQLFDIDPATAAGTAIGEPDADAHPIFAIDVDNDGHGYATGQVTVDDETSVATLWVADANTGTFSSPVTIEIPLLGSEVYCPSIDYSGGQILITCNQEGDGSFITVLGVVDPATGDVEVIIGIEADGETYTEFTALATSPAGVLWAFGYDNVAPFAATVDLGSETVGERLPLVNNDGEAVAGADFDRDGQLFATVLAEGDPVFATVDLGTGAVTAVAEYPFVELTGSASAITVWGNAPALAATGAAGALPVGLGSALLLLVGAAFIANGRWSRRVSAPLDQR